MAVFEKINGSEWRIEAYKDWDKKQFFERFKDRIKFNFDLEDTWKKLESEIKKRYPKKPTK